MKLTPEDLKSILSQLQNAGLDAIIVGGQSVNLWAYQYLQNIPQLQEYLPFASEDLDFYGGKLEAAICQEILGGQLILNRDFDPSPNAGLVLIDYPDYKLRIDFLASVYGLNDAEIIDTALTFTGQEPLEGLCLKLLHPLLCLEGKLRCLRGLPQGGRQDLKHVKILALCLHEFFQDLIRHQQFRPALKLFERVIKTSLREDGLSAWYHHQIDILNTLPIQEIQRIDNQKLQDFYTVRWPKVNAQLRERRTRYQQLIERHQNL
jgi:hypothetical protein